MAGKPDFSHLSLTDKNCSRWGAYMEPLGDKLANELWQYGTAMTSWGTCPVCEAEYPPNVASHVRGKAHCNKLKEKLGWQEPQSQEHVKQFDQLWHFPGLGKSYYFNHITGEQQLIDTPTGPQAPGVAQPPPVAQPAMPALAQPAAPMMAASPQGATDLLVDHNLGYLAALQKVEAWKALVDKPAALLDDELGKRTCRWDHPCAVCENKAMTRGTHDHFKSKGHWTALWKKVNGAPPPPEEVMRMDRQWVQSWQVPGGALLFNHFTGAVKFQVSGGQAATPAAPAPAPAMQPPVQAQGPFPTPVPPAMPPAPMPVVPTAPAVPVAAVASVAPEPEWCTQHNMDFRTAIDDKYNWWYFMEAPAAELTKRLGEPSAECQLCKQPMEDAQEHLTSPDHWWTLWDIMQKLNQNLPSDEVAQSMENRPWVQSFQTPKGQLVFSHLTGALLRKPSQPAVEAQPKAAPQLPQPVPQVPQPMPQAPERVLRGSAPAQLAPPAPHRMPVAAAAPSPVPTRCGITYKEAFNAIDKWKKFMEEPTTRLDAVVYGMMSGYTGQCPVCESNMLGFNEHLCSQKHWKKLWQKFSTGPPDPPIVTDWDKPWVQQIATSRGKYFFNHVTGEQGLESEILGDGGPPAPGRTGISPINTDPVPVAMPPMPSTPDTSMPPEQTGAGNPASPVHPVHPLPAGAAAAGAAGLSHLHWKCIVHAAARKLQEEIAAGEEELDDPWQERDAECFCSLCRCRCADMKEHLESVEHFNKVQACLADAARSNPSVEDLRRTSAWMQSFETVVFNHLTLEIIAK
ncbi:unnamed protein product [Effrenium voratum]|nr:unnamed protein product [Effrenium voratum]